MPFPQQRPRPFTREGVEALRLGRFGVYGLLSDVGEYIYIGSGDVRTHLLAHLDGVMPSVTERRPVSWVEWTLEARASWKIALLPALENRQRELIEEYSPRCNAERP